MNSEIIKNISIPKSASIRTALNAIDTGALGVALIINEDFSFYRLITDGDIRRALLQGNGLETSVQRIKCPESVTANERTSSEEISQLLNEKIRCIPILDNNHHVVDLYIHDKRSNLPVMEPQIGSTELQYISECILTGWVSSTGKFVTEFESMFADFCGAKYAVATSNGTTALHLALLSLNIGKGDEVIVPTLTFIATANAVTYTGAKPVFIDCNPKDWTIDTDKIEEKITPKTKAIIPVHLYGQPAHMDKIHEIATKYKLAVIEDAAQAHGALYKTFRVGLINSTDIGCFSFFGNKIVTTGEGGMVVTNQENLKEKIQILRDHGMSKDQRYFHKVLGYNYRMTNMQAAIGVAQMEKIDTILQQKQILANQYKKALENIPGLTLPIEKSYSKSVCWLYSILVDKSEFGIDRDNLMDVLKKNNIDTRPLFIPVHQQPIYNTGQSLPVAERISSSGLSLPSSINLSENDINYVATVIAEQCPHMKRL